MTTQSQPPEITGDTTCRPEQYPDQTGVCAEQWLKRGPYGVAASLAIAVAIWVTSLLIDMIWVFVVTLVELSRNPTLDVSIFIGHPDAQGLLMTLGTCITMPLCVVLVVGLIKLRRGPSIADYLALKPVSFGTVAKWVGITFVLGLIFSGMSSAADRPMPQFIIDAYEGADFYPMLWVGLVVGAPVYEELFFRGFLFEGILQLRLGSVGAVVLTSLIWAGVHLHVPVF